MGLAVVRDLRAPASPEELAEFETDVLAGFVLARPAAGLADGMISSDVVHLEQIRAWLGRPLWEMEPADADLHLGKVMRDAAKALGWPERRPSRRTSCSWSCDTRSRSTS